jgi:hypothetical protein
LCKRFLFTGQVFGLVIVNGLVLDKISLTRRRTHSKSHGGMGNTATSNRHRRRVTGVGTEKKSSGVLERVSRFSVQTQDDALGRDTIQRSNPFSSGSGLFK